MKRLEIDKDYILLTLILRLVICMNVNRRISNVIGLRPSSVQILKLFVKDSRPKTFGEIRAKTPLSMTAIHTAIRELISKGLLHFEKIDDRVLFKLSRPLNIMIEEFKTNVVKEIEDYFK
ncbi:MAG: hypothetical protein BPH43C_23 [Phage 5P_1]|nr:MAG: hypothetical protein BPH43C_23 [Phage 5P_1]